MPPVKKAYVNVNFAVFCQQGGDSEVSSNNTNPKKSYGSLVTLGLQNALFGFLREIWGRNVTKGRILVLVAVSGKVLLSDGYLSNCTLCGNCG